MTNTPEFLNDTKTRLSAEGFITDRVWYHGTTSALWSSIMQSGLKRSGDHQLKQATKKTMATIGNHYSETIEPVFLTPSKALAYYWAEQKVKERGGRFAENEEPVVIEVVLDANDNALVKPDVGAASLLLIEEGERYLVFLAKLYELAGLSAPIIDLKNADRMAFLTQLGMAYFDKDISKEQLKLVNA